MGLFSEAGEEEEFDELTPENKSKAGCISGKRQ